MTSKQDLVLDPEETQPPLRNAASSSVPASLPPPKEAKVSPASTGGENASIYFVGTATTIFEWEGIRLMTDPNFLHAGDHVHLGPGVQGTRQTNPAIDLSELPRIDAVLLSHYHADHFDQDVEASLRRSLPIITTPHAKEHLTGKGEGESFNQVYDLDFYDSMFVDIKTKTSSKSPAIKVTGMPGKHVPPGPAGMLAAANELLQAVPPTNGWMLELGYKSSADNSSSFRSGYRVYISGDTLMIDELKEIPERYKGQNIDLMLIHLGGTTIPSPKMPLLMVTMDAKQGIELVQLINPDLTIPIHFDDYDVFLSPLSDFKKEVEKAGLTNKVVYLDRKDQFKFSVKQDHAKA
ncbi:Metallo-hydrolase/oxidoreductase [Myriangium duriaei CBS 260.36]|uniref:Metallo-hydrolase/oxidoreductase n=1 Tax=Myriangium duriaei CBS 260.36 TaxID=1168546 RepID=A0A9P4J2E1_9PEZI|nr:Metallo-hydrolase/oxidoreductase [Myriangium duriaei CBS 260.36]